MHKIPRLLNCTGVIAVLSTLLATSLARSQNSEASASTPPSPPTASGTSTVPRLIKFSGELNPQITQIAQSKNNEVGKQSLPTMITATFSLYELQEGGSALWSESQKVQIDDQGRYTVLLGATQAEGLPLDLFTSGQALWLGVQPQVPGATEEPRVLLVAVPYALKASDSDTLGGLPASAYALAAPGLNAANGASSLGAPVPGTGSSPESRAPSPETQPQPAAACSSVTADGKAAANQVALYSGSCALTENANLVYANGNLGVGTITPSSPLSVVGTFGDLTANGSGGSVQTTWAPTANDATNSVFGLNLTTQKTGKFSSTAPIGVRGVEGIAQNSGAGSVTGLAGIYVSVKNQGTGTVRNAYGAYISAPTASATNPITYAYGVNIVAQKAAGVAHGYGLYAGGVSDLNYFGGSLGIGTATPVAKLEVNGAAQFDLGVTFKQPLTFASGQTFPIPAKGVTDAMLANSYAGVGSCATGKVVMALARNAAPTCSTGVMGTVTSVGSGAGLTGGAITASGTLSIATAGVTNAMLANPSLTVTAGTDLAGGGAVALGGSVTLNLDTTKVPTLGATTNTFGGSIVAKSFAGNGASLTSLEPANLSAGTAGINISGVAATATNATQLGGWGAGDFALLGASSNTFTGSVTASSFTGSGAGLTQVNAGQLGGLASSAFPQLATANTFTLSQTLAGGTVLPATGTATAGKPLNSNALDLVASSWNGTSAVNQLFRWQAEGSGSAATGSLNLLYLSGAGTPAETGFSINKQGQIKFAPGQPFPSSVSTINKITAGTDLTGGGTTGNVTLNLDTSAVPTLGAANNSFTGSVSATSFSGDGAKVTNVNAATLGGLLPSAFQAAGAYATLGANTFNGSQMINSGYLSLPPTTATAGVISLGGNRFAHAFGSANTFLGINAGNFSTTGTGGSTGTGMNALMTLSTGYYNTATGLNSLAYDSTGYWNTGYGNATLYVNDAGNYNTAIGACALLNTTTDAASAGCPAQSPGLAGGNTALGYYAGSGNTTGNSNTFVGYQASSAQGNLVNATAIGANAMVGENNALVLGGTGSNAVNVGVGTATPQYTLDVHGSGNFTGILTAVGQNITGNVSTGGQLVSTVATGTAPLQVGSTTQVANLNASLLAGHPPSDFQPAGSYPILGGNEWSGNTFTGLQQVVGANLEVSTGTTVGGAQCAWACGNIVVDASGVQTGYYTPGIMFGGTGSGETIVSNRNASQNTYGGNVNGLDFYTYFRARMSITNGGQVGINTQNPGGMLEVDAPDESGLDAGVFSGALSANGNTGTGVTAWGGADTSSGGSSPAPGGDFIGGYSVNSAGAGGVWGRGGDGGADGGDGIYGIGGRDTSSNNTYAGGVGGWFAGGNSSNGFGGWGIVATPGSGPRSSDYGGWFNEQVTVTGDLHVGGQKNFVIDHPLDPANKYLYHSSVESSEMMNIYTGNVTTDAQGDATVDLPDWFEAVNTDFRYQLTVIGQFAQAIVASEISNHRFTIKTDKPKVKVSWQVTGVRQDAYAKAHPLQVEVDKPERERGYYLHPELYGAREEKGMLWAHYPEMMKRMKEPSVKERRPSKVAPGTKSR